MEAIVVTAICPHSLSFRPIVINSDRKLDIIARRLNPGSTLMVDGQVSMGLKSEDVVRVSRDRSSFMIVNNPVRTQWQTLATKLNWASKPKYKSD